MRLGYLTVLFVLLLGGIPASPTPGQTPVPPGAVHVITVEQAITGATTRYIKTALERASASEADCLIIQLDTPGGLLDATRDIVQTILSSRIPVVVYIAPAGARAASAGTMITLASHVAAMAPATHIGAAHPVSLFGGGENKVMNEKIVNDTAAFIESIAQLRHRNVEWAISAVRESKSITAQKAKELGVVEILADNLTDLIEQLNGRQVHMDKTTVVTLHTLGKPVINQDMTFSQSFFSAVSNPNLVFFFLALGILGLYIEFSNPGLILPGVVGTISLIMALIAMQTLPISYGALGLILLGAALLVAESLVPSFGILGFGGIAALLFGSLFLLDESQTDLRISRPMIFITVGTIALVALVIGRLLIKSLRSPPVSFQANMVGRAARVQQAITPTQPGSVIINGEIWQAEADQPLEVGSKVTVEAVTGLVVRVRSRDTSAANPPAPGSAI